MVRAMQFSKLGGPEVLQLIENYELPPADDDEVVVRVHAAGINPVDTKVRDPAWGRNSKLPRTPGGDVAGTVLSDGKKWKKGENILALTDRFSTRSTESDGAYAELALVKEDWAVAPPKNLPLHEALESAKLQPGARVLIQAASGGVGVFAVQLAKQLFGAFVVGTCGPKNLEFVKGLGADEVVNYREQDFAEVYKEPAMHFDAIIDTIGGEAEKKAYGIIKPGGTFAHIINSGTDPARHEAGKRWTDKRYTVTWVHPDGRQLAKVVELVEAGKVVVPIAKVWPLEQAAEAQKELDAGHTRGKHVLLVAEQ